MNRELLTQRLARLIIVITEEPLTKNEMKNMDIILSELEQPGRGEDLLSVQHKEKLEKIAGVREYFIQHPRDYLLIIGNSRIPRSQIVGLAGEWGITEPHLQLELEYDKLKGNFPFEAAQNHRCAGIIIAEMPHKVIALGGHTSGVEALTATGLFTFTCSNLKLTKEQLRQAFNAFGIHLQKQIPFGGNISPSSVERNDNSNTFLHTEIDSDRS
ncbi:hypothetical protein IT401_02120 [Candidatus Nomurabacteria bacterium]|nr:hypothetical protein [Candidatus Nomurabacteria bacterium]